MTDVAPAPSAGSGRESASRVPVMTPSRFTATVCSVRSGSSSANAPRKAACGVVYDGVERPVRLLGAREEGLEGGGVADVDGEPGGPAADLLRGGLRELEVEVGDRDLVTGGDCGFGGGAADAARAARDGDVHDPELKGVGSMRGLR